MHGLHANEGDLITETVSLLKAITTATSRIGPVGLNKRSIHQGYLYTVYLDMCLTTYKNMVNFFYKWIRLE